ncbi:MAG: protein jag [Treponema sp.]|jgi:spoIIIJ-associated protein|nr:protein jag [Treponema sp.]
MEYEFEGRTEKEAIDHAAEALGLAKDAFDVEILESRRGGLFKKGYVKIKIHTNQTPPVTQPAPADSEEAEEPEAISEAERKLFTDAVFGNPVAQNAFEQQLIDFTEGLISRMGYLGTVTVLFREDRKIGLKMDSEYSSILIGKKGKNLDALQLIVNIYAGRQGHEDTRVILDTENYRIRREESLVRLAYTVADRVRTNRGSVLLEPMNPFDRRLIHTTLSDVADVHTKSEGDGLYKQVRVYYRGAR